MRGPSLARSSTIFGDQMRVGLLTLDSILVRAQVLFLLLTIVILMEAQ